jgi:TP901 family phage tail tape measure protein
VEPITRLFVQIGADVSGALAGFEQVKQATNNLSRDLNRSSQALSGAGRTLTTAVSLPLLAIGTAAVKASIDFESAFAGVRKTVDATEAEFAVLRKGIRDMAKEMPASAAAIAQVVEAAGQLGIENENLLSFSKTMIQLGASTNLSATDAAMALARFANITQMSQRDFDRLGSTIVDLGNNFATTERDIVEMVMRLAGAGQVVGLTQAQMLGLATAMSSLGIEAQMGGSAISRVMVEIANSVAQADERLALLAATSGMSATEFQRAWKEDAAGALIAFVEGLAKVQEEGGNLFALLDALGFGEIRVRDTLLRMAGSGDLVRQSLERANKAWAENNALQEEFSRRLETTASKLKIVFNRVWDAAISLGDALTPAILTLVAAAEPLFRLLEIAVDVFTALPPEIQAVALAAAALAIALGPLLLLAGALASAWVSLASLSTLLGISFVGVLGPIGLIIAAIVALIAVAALLDVNFKTLLKGLADAAKSQLKFVLNEIEVAIGAITGLVRLTKALLTGDWATAWDAAKAIAKAALHAISLLPRLFLNALWEGGKALGASLGEGIRIKIAEAINAIIDQLNSLISKINGLKLPFRIGGPGIGEIGKITVPIRELGEAAGEAAQQIEKQLGSTKGAAEAAGGASIDMDALNEAMAGAGDGAEKAAKQVNILEDGIITMAEAVANNLTPAQAGAIEAVDALAREQARAEEEAWNLQKVLSKVAYAFNESTKAAQEMVLALAREALAKTKAAVSAVFGGPTQEVAQLELQLAQLSRESLILEQTLKPQRQALEAQLKAARDVTAKTEAERDAKDRNVKAIEAQIAALDAQKARYDQQIDAVRGQIDLYAANAKVLQAQITAADQSLLTEAERQAKGQELIGVMAEQSLAVRDLSAAIGQDLIPEMDAARKAHEELRATIFVLTYEALRNALIPTVTGPDGVVVAFNAAAAYASLLADAAKSATGGVREMAAAANTAAGAIKYISSVTAAPTTASALTNQVAYAQPATGVFSSVSSVGSGVPERDLVHGYDSGGVVPGRIGAPQLALVHGGETILPTHVPGFDLDRFIGRGSYSTPGAAWGAGGAGRDGILIEIDKVIAVDEAGARRAGGDIGWAIESRLRGGVS